MRAALEFVENPIFVKDRQHRFVLANHAGCVLLGRAREEIIGRTDHDLLPATQADGYIANDRLVIATGRPQQYEEVLTDRSGNVRSLLTRKTLFQRPGGEDFVIVYVNDLSDFVRAKAQILHGVEHDSLTGLANTILFRQTLNEVLARRSADGYQTAIVLIDLDRFGNVNHALGRAAGDNLLVQFAQLLSDVARPCELIARLGGDEFAVILHAVDQPAAADAIAAALFLRLDAPLSFGARQVHLSASAGIAVAGSGKDGDTLLRRAELALRQSKLEGRNQRRFFEATMEVRRPATPFLEEDLRSALQRQEFSVVFQPIARVTDRKIFGYEALLRWTHPVLGPIPPSVFIPLAESEGLIVSIGEWVLREACSQAARWPKGLHIAVNVSPVQFTRADLPSLVRSIVTDTGLDPQCLEIEITETSVIGDIAGALGIFADLHAIGTRIVLDDFGAGFSSLDVLNSLPFDKLKIDRSLVKGVGESKKAEGIISGILRMSHTLNLRVVAEGVETEEQLAVLLREHCEAFQGFLLGKPKGNPFEAADD